MPPKTNGNKKSELSDIEKRGMVAMFFSMIAYSSVPQLLMLIAETEPVLAFEWERMPWRGRLLLGEVTTRPEVAVMTWAGMNDQVRAEFVGRVRAAAKRALLAMAANDERFKRDVQLAGGQSYLAQAA